MHNCAVSLGDEVRFQKKTKSVSFDTLFLSMFAKVKQRQCTGTGVRTDHRTGIVD